MKFIGGKNKNGQARKTLRWIRKQMNKKQRSLFKNGADTHEAVMLSREGWAWKNGRKGTLMID
jgi:hypothetical protein